MPKKLTITESRLNSLKNAAVTAKGTASELADLAREGLIESNAQGWRVNELGYRVLKEESMIP